MKAVVLVVALTAQALAAPGAVVRVEHRDPSAVPSLGSAKAPVTVELFFIPGPLSRGSWYRALEELQERHPTKIRLVYRVLVGAGQTRVPFVALEAAAEGRYAEFMDKLHETLTSKPTNLSDAQLAEVAKSAGMDADRALAAMKDPPLAYKHVVEGNERRRKQHVHSANAPTLLFNGRPITTALVALTTADLEREYRTALDQAEDLLDRGAVPSTLTQAFDDERALPSEILAQTGATDEEIGEPAADPPLANPPLDLRGLPSYGSPDAAVTLVVACSPTSLNCDLPLGAARLTQEVYPEQVRVVWAPYFDVARDDAADLAMLGDAAMCAEQVGTSLEHEGDFDSTTSPGWRWVTAVLGEVKNRRRRVTTDQLIDRVADKLHVDKHAFATCRARLAGKTLDWVEAGRHAGLRTSPATVVGGRVYGPIVDWTTLQLLVEAELAPGLLGEAAPAWIRVLP
jgi:protein-disulfide isomerase